MPLDIGFTLKMNPAALQQIKNALRKSFEIAMTSVHQDAAELAPGKPGTSFGHNKRSIDTEVKEEGGKVVATIFTQSGYGGYLEIGTVKMPARPYLKPAFDRNRDLFLQATKIALK